MKKSDKQGLRGQLRNKSLSRGNALGPYASYDDYLAYKRRERRKLSVKEQNHGLLIAYDGLVPVCQVHIAEAWWDTLALQREPRNPEDIRKMYFRQHVETAKEAGTLPFRPEPTSAVGVFSQSRGRIEFRLFTRN